MRRRCHDQDEMGRRNGEGEGEGGGGEEAEYDIEKKHRQLEHYSSRPRDLATMTRFDNPLY